MNNHKDSPKHPSLCQKISGMRQQFKNFERTLRFYWKSLMPAPETPFGFQLYGSRAMQDGRFEPLETRLLNEILPHCDAFINVGANVGYYCCHAIRKNVPVFAFEPIDLNVRHLLANIRINDWADKIEIYPVALGSEPGILEIYGAGTGASLIKGWANARETDFLLVPVLTLDQVLGDRLAGKRCLIMVDIEGAEHFMLAGANRFLAAEPKPIWMMEVCVNQNHSGAASINPHLLETFARFWKNGYQAWTIDERPRLIERAEVEVIASGGKNTLETYNFIFLDPAVVEELGIFH